MSPDPRTLHAGQVNILKPPDSTQLSGNAKVLEDLQQPSATERQGTGYGQAALRGEAGLL